MCRSFGMLWHNSRSDASIQSLLLNLLRTALRLLLLQILHEALPNLDVVLEESNIRIREAAKGVCLLYTSDAADE